MLQIKNLNQYYDQSHTLWDINIDIKQGDCVCLMGRNGVGKTTLLKCIMGLLSIEKGNINYDGLELTNKDASVRACEGMGYVPQGREIFPQLTVEENLKIGLYARKDKIKKIPEHIFDMFPVLKQMLSRRGGDLSGGQQQQLAIGRALVLDPKFLILDEPTEGIQPNIVSEIGDVIIKLNKEHNITVLIVEQKLLFARRVGSRFIIMDRGRIEVEGKMSLLSEDIIQQYLTV